jgi:hypothetical protein
MSHQLIHIDPFEEDVAPWSEDCCGNSVDGLIFGPPDMTDDEILGSHSKALREPRDTFVCGPTRRCSDVGGVLGPSHCVVDQSEKNWHDRVALVQQFLASKPVLCNKPHADYAGSTENIWCDLCGVACTGQHHHGKSAAGQLLDFCPGCTTAARYMQFPVMSHVHIKHLRAVVDKMNNDEIVKSMSQQQISACRTAQKN